MTIPSPIRAVDEELRRGLLQYLRRAYAVLSHVESPVILDVGCGTGLPTVELARLSGGQVTGLDIEPESLDQLEARAQAAGMAGGVTTVLGSHGDMSFTDQSFDILWAEGSIYAIGFEKGLRAWRRLLKPGGHLVVHDDLGDVEAKLRAVPDSGYELLDHFVLARTVWWDEYYGPLEAAMRELDPPRSAWVDQKRREIEMLTREPDRAQSVYFVMRKTA